MEENKTVEMEVAEKETKETLWSRLKKVDKKAVAKKVILIGGGIAGIIIASKVMKKYGIDIDQLNEETDQKEVYDDVCYEADPKDSVDEETSSEE